MSSGYQSINGSILDEEDLDFQPIPLLRNSKEQKINKLKLNFKTEEDKLVADR